MEMSYQEGAPPSAGEAVGLEDLGAKRSDDKRPPASSSYKVYMSTLLFSVYSVFSKSVGCKQFRRLLILMSPSFVYFCLPFQCERKPLINGSEEEYQASKSFKVSEYDAPPTANAWWWQHPDIKQNWKAVLCSAVMLIVGILIMAAGIVFEAVHKEHIASVIFIIIGFLFFVPGLYHTGYIYFAAKGMRGFEMKQLSIFNMSR